jgi:hypothetical protein
VKDVLVSLLFSVLFLIPLHAEVQQNADSKQTGSALYLSGEYVDAANRFLADALNAPRVDKTFSYYNAARSYHQDYLVNQNIDSLEKAISGYYRVLDYNPEHKEARINLELARLEQEKLQKKEENRAENQQKDDAGEESGQDSTEGDPSSLDDLAQKQKELSESSSSEENESRQKDLAEETRNALENSENQPSEEALKEALAEQQKALDQMKEGKDAEAKESQKAAARALEQAAGTSEAAGDEELQDSLPEDLQSLINQEQSRNKNEAKELIQVERNW